MTNDYMVGTGSGSLTVSTTGGSSWTHGDEYTTPDYEMPHTVSIPSVWTEPIVKYPTPYMGYYKTFDELHESSWSRIMKPKGGDNMRYLYEVILVNPKNDTFVILEVVARSETSALMQAYDRSGLKIDFDDLKTYCKVLMEWKKEKSLKKAIETIKEAVE